VDGGWLWACGSRGGAGGGGRLKGGGRVQPHTRPARRPGSCCTALAHPAPLTPVPLAATTDAPPPFPSPPPPPHTHIPPTTTLTHTPLPQTYDVQRAGVKYRVKAVRLGPQALRLHLGTTHVDVVVRKLNDGGLLVQVRGRRPPLLERNVAGQCLALTPKPAVPPNTPPPPFHRGCRQVDGSSLVVHGEEEALGTRLTIDSRTCLLSNEHDPSRVGGRARGKGGRGCPAAATAWRLACGPCVPSLIAQKPPSPPHTHTQTNKTYTPHPIPSPHADAGCVHRQAGALPGGGWGAHRRRQPLRRGGGDEDDDDAAGARLGCAARTAGWGGPAYLSSGAGWLGGPGLQGARCSCMQEGTGALSCDEPLVVPVGCLCVLAGPHCRRRLPPKNTTAVHRAQGACASSCPRALC
jgi:hypothetical protein